MSALCLWPGAGVKTVKRGRITVAVQVRLSLRNTSEALELGSAEAPHLNGHRV